MLVKYFVLQSCQCYYIFTESWVKEEPLKRLQPIARKGDEDIDDELFQARVEVELAE